MQSEGRACLVPLFQYGEGLMGRDKLVPPLTIDSIGDPRKDAVGGTRLLVLLIDWCRRLSVFLSRSFPCFADRLLCRNQFEQIVHPTIAVTFRYRRDDR